jgi:hypothetical protein
MCQDVLMRARPPKRRPAAASRRLQAFNVPVSRLIAVQHGWRADSLANQRGLFAARMSKNGRAHIVVMRWFYVRHSEQKSSKALY